jgi:CRP-like cAMP-binding protein
VEVSVSDSIRIVGEALRGRSRFSIIGSFVSPDGTSLGFVDAGVDDELGERLHERLLIHLKSIVPAIHVEKREFLWHPNEATKEELSNKLMLEFKTALHNVFVDARKAGGQVPVGMRTFFAVSAGRSVFLLKYGEIDIRLMGKSGFSEVGCAAPDYFTDFTDFTDVTDVTDVTGLNDAGLGAVEVYVIKVDENDRLLIASGESFSGMIDSQSKVGSDYQLISDSIRSVRDASFGSRGALFLIGVDNAYKVAIERGFGDVAETLSKVTLFRDLDREEIASLLVIATKRCYSAGELIFDQGMEGQSLLVLVSGAVGVFVEKKEHIVRKNPGEFFGESGFLEGLPRSGSLIAKTDSVLLEIMNDHLWDLIRNKPTLGVKILTRIASNTARKRREASARLSARGDQKSLPTLPQVPQESVIDRMTPAESRHWVQACSKALRNSLIFQWMDANEIGFVIGNSVPRQFPPGAVIMREGSESDSVYLGLGGRVRVGSDSESSDAMSVFGEVLGAVEFMDHLPVEKVVYAVTDVVMLAIPNSLLSELITSHPKIGTKILWSIGQLMSRKIREQVHAGYPDLDLDFDDEAEGRR